MPQPMNSEFPEIRRTLRLAAGAAIAAVASAAALPSMAAADLRDDFARLDRNRDARVSFAEMAVDRGQSKDATPEPLALSPERARIRELVLKVVFERLDVDRNGWVSFDEYRRADRPASTRA
jgi:hypothetical protein